MFDLRLMAGLSEGSDLLTVLTPDRPDVVFRDLDLVVYGRVAATKRVARSPLADFTTAAESRARWRVAMIHGSMVIPGKVEQDDVIFASTEVAASGLDYLALGHWHSWLTGQAGSTTWAYSGAPEPMALDQTGAGRVAIVNLEERAGERVVTVEPVTVGRTRFGSLELDATEVAFAGGPGQPAHGPRGPGPDHGRPRSAAWRRSAWTSTRRPWRESCRHPS